MHNLGALFLFKEKMIILVKTGIVSVEFNLNHNWGWVANPATTLTHLSIFNTIDINQNKDFKK